ncbi:MAG TPA: TonB-dependent receptor [Gammaproteobacteria bacterium]|jgi:hypothetical protein|nr:TonB-dependent receptor [Gammaproteobacteria bacterium]
MRVAVPEDRNVNEHPVDPREKALKVNLDPRFYGAFAEIGAGQEVVRWFFRAGGAAGTIAKSISAYDMQVSDAIYGPCQRYVCRERLESMLEYEQRLNLERLSGARGSSTAFFAFADTVSARSFRGNNECHGWMGIRFQSRPGGANQQIVIHVRMLDHENAAQQEALGIVGVNLIYGACYYCDEPERLLESLLDGLSTNRIEIDLIDFSGDEFASVDNRVLSLKLVQLGLTGAAMFSARGKVLQPSEVLYKKPVLIERGRFRPVTYVNLDLAAAALRRFEQVAGDVEPGETVSIMEITMRNLMTQGEVDLADFLSRADVLATTGHTVMISDYVEYYRLAAYLFRYTHRPIGLAMGAVNLRDIFDESYYSKLEGGILESFGRLFKNSLKLFVYPYVDEQTHELITVDNLRVPPALRHLFGYLVDRGCIVQLDDYNPEYLKIYSHDVLRRIGPHDSEWESMVPPAVAAVIKARGLFGYAQAAGESRQRTAV